MDKRTQSSPTCAKPGQPPRSRIISAVEGVVCFKWKKQDHFLLCASEPWCFSCCTPLESGFFAADSLAPRFPLRRRMFLSRFPFRLSWRRHELFHTAPRGLYRLHLTVRTHAHCFSLRTLDKVIPSTRSRIAILTNEVTCNHRRTQSSTRRVHPQSDLSKTEIEYCSKDSQPHDQRQKSHWKTNGIRSSSSSCSLFVMMCRPVQGDLYGILSQLLRKNHNSKLIFE